MRKKISHNAVHYLFTTGVPIEEIAKIFNITTKGTLNILRSNGVEFEKAKKINEQDIISVIQKFHNETKSVSGYEYSRLGYEPSIVTIKRIFGTWENAIAKSGLDALKVKITPDPERKIYTKEEIVELMKQYIVADRSIIKRKTYIERGYQPSVHVISQHFGSWRSLLLELGLDINTKSLRR